MGSETPTFRTMLTIPNGLSVLRLLGVPLFLWLILGPGADGWALLVLALSGFTDWLDGQLARAWHQTSRLGELLDPAADRLYIFAALIGLTARDIIPLELAAALVLRDVVLVACGPILRRHGYGALPVHFLGKAATFNLLYAFPLLLLGGGSGTVSTVAKVVGWAFAIWGTALYWWSAVLYVVQVRQLVRLDRQERRRMPQPPADPQSEASTPQRTDPGNGGGRSPAEPLAEPSTGYKGASAAARGQAPRDRPVEPSTADRDHTDGNTGG